MDGIAWSVIMLTVTLALAWSTLLIGAIKWLLTRYQEHINGRFNSLEKATKDRTERLHQLDRDLLKLRAELPNQYVRREDWIRFGGQIDSKLDALYERLDGFRAEVNNARSGS